MQNFSIKSIVLGVGIGIILTSIISMIYLAGATPQMSKDEIIAKAKEYGMVNSYELRQSQIPQAQEDANKVVVSATPTPQISTSTPIPNTPAPTATPTAAPKAAGVNGTNVARIKIVRGDSGESVGRKLVEAGLVNNKYTFTRELSNMGLKNLLKPGEYTIAKGTDLKSIIKTITFSKR
ncbi:MAG: endolytic transglycosylase MltG [Clostridia bacterium]|nr:endolytic transglycosylase MltG [Clostridia bacterium]